jgi:hypothetical protein
LTSTSSTWITHEKHQGYFQTLLVLIVPPLLPKKHYIDNDKHSKHPRTPKPIKLLSDCCYLLITLINQCIGKWKVLQTYKHQMNNTKSSLSNDMLIGQVTNQAINVSSFMLHNKSSVAYNWRKSMHPNKKCEQQHSTCYFLLSQNLVQGT